MGYSQGIAFEEGIRVGIYARQSVDEEQGISQQIDDCRAEAIRRGWVVVDAYTDNDTSATKQRDIGTAWASMLAAFDRGEINTVLTTRVDRLTRKLVDVLELTP
ncbi:recombinase family protein [Scrofimicrobium canadense]|uniref:recombinase family protein n=1 Tax=Scrofimicrobium canadense TaxID=2652290 RepID=UPI0012B39F94|nr:recombinase family protein [Scrofimicrobium canadense]